MSRLKIINKILVFFLIFPAVLFAQNNIFNFSAFNNTNIILQNSHGQKVGYDGNDIFEEIKNSEVFLNGDFQGIKINNLDNGQYFVNLHNKNSKYEKTVLSFMSDRQNVNRRAYFFLNKNNRINFKIENGKLILGKNYSIVKKLRLNKVEWKLSWESDNVTKYRLYGRKENEKTYTYIAETNNKEYTLTGDEKKYKEYVVTKIFSSSPYKESGIFPNVLGAVVSIDDIDEDGIADEWEDIMGTDKTKKDTDGDGIDDVDEILESGSYPTNGDTDGDGILDGEDQEPLKKKYNGMSTHRRRELREQGQKQEEEQNNINQEEKGIAEKEVRFAEEQDAEEAGDKDKNIKKENNNLIEEKNEFKKGKEGGAVKREVSGINNEVKLLVKNNNIDNKVYDNIDNEDKQIDDERETAEQFSAEKKHKTTTDRINKIIKQNHRQAIILNGGTQSFWDNFINFFKTIFNFLWNLF